MGIADGKYIAFTTFRRDGTPVSTPVWVVSLDTPNSVGFWTSSGSGKAKRLAHTDRITVQASDARGRANDGAPLLEGTAEVLSEGPVFDEVKRKIVDKYGFQTKLTKLIGTVVSKIMRKHRPYGDRVVVVTLPADA